MPDIEPKIYPAEFKESAIRLAIESKGRAPVLQLSMNSL